MLVLCGFGFLWEDWFNAAEVRVYENVGTYASDSRGC